MGLDTTHDCWHGAYSAFMTWRTLIAEVAGLPPLELMEGFFSDRSPHRTLDFGQSRDDLYERKTRYMEQRLPIKWSCLKPSPLHELLYHSDCDGEIPWQSCAAIANELEKLLPLMNVEFGGHIGNAADKTRTFIEGLRKASAAQENVGFH